MSIIDKNEVHELFAKITELIYGDNPGEKDVAKMHPSYVLCLGLSALMDRNRQLEQRVKQLEALVNP